MTEVLLTNAKVFDGSGRPSFPGEVLVDGARIAGVAKVANAFDRHGRTVIDCGGHTLMPGMVEPHAHLTFPSSIDRLVIGEEPPLERLTLLAAHNARVTLDCGFTSVYSAGGHHGEIELALKHEIDAGYLPGPRMVASCSEIERRDQPADHDSLKAQVRALADLGYGSLKYALSGFDGEIPGGSSVATYSQDEVAAIGEEAEAAGVSLACHAIAGEAVKRAARGGFRMLYHCSYADEEALDAMESRKAALYCAPAAGLLHARVHKSLEPEKSHAEAARYKAFSTRELDGMLQVIPQMRRRGIRVLPGGDYGFAHNPIGANAFDLELFVDLFGFSPAEALQAATKLGGDLMRLPLGEVREGLLADLLLVKGDPTANVRLLQDQENLLVIMQDGRFHKRVEPGTQTPG